MSSRLFLRADQAHFPVKLRSFLFQKELPRLHAQQIRDNVHEHERRGTRNNGSEDLGHRQHDGNSSRVRTVGPEVDQMRGTT